MGVKWGVKHFVQDVCCANDWGIVPFNSPFNSINIINH